MIKKKIYCKDHQTQLYNVIVNTIKFDNLIGEIIATGLGLEPQFINDYELTNQKEIERFYKFFYTRLESPIKLTIIKDILKHDFQEGNLPKKFECKFQRLYEIRNQFAHRLYPKQFPRKGKNDDLENWVQLHNEHTEIYKELSGWLFRKCFVYLASNEQLE